MAFFIRAFVSPAGELFAVATGDREIDAQLPEGGGQSIDLICEGDYQPARTVRPLLRYEGGGIVSDDLTLTPVSTE